CEGGHAAGRRHGCHSFRELGRRRAVVQHPALQGYDSAAATIGQHTAVLRRGRAAIAREGRCYNASRSPVLAPLAGSSPSIWIAVWTASSSVPSRSATQ